MPDDPKPSPKTCASCKSLKQRCDRRRPCSRCLMRGHTCIDPPQQSSRPSRKRRKREGGKRAEETIPPSSSSSSIASSSSAATTKEEGAAGNKRDPGIQAVIGPPPEMLNDSLDIYANIVNVCASQIQKLSSQGLIDRRKALCVLQSWNRLVGRMGVDQTRGLLSRAQATLGITDEELNNLDHCSTTQVDASSASTSKRQCKHDERDQEEESSAGMSLEEDDGEGGGKEVSRSKDIPEHAQDFLHPYLSVMDDWKAAVIAWVGDVESNQIRFVINERFGERFASIHEITQRVFGQGVLPSFVMASFVSSADRSTFLEELMSHNFHSPDVLCERDLMLRCIDRRGRNFLAFLRMRSQWVIQRRYWATCISIQPLPVNRWIDVADAGGATRDWQISPNGGNWQYALLYGERLPGLRRVFLNTGPCRSQGAGLRAYSTHADSFFGEKSTTYCLGSIRVDDDKEEVDCSNLRASGGGGGCGGGGRGGCGGRGQALLPEGRKEVPCPARKRRRSSSASWEPEGTNAAGSGGTAAATAAFNASAAATTGGASSQSHDGSSCPEKGEGEEGDNKERADSDCSSTKNDDVAALVSLNTSASVCRVSQEGNVTYSCHSMTVAAYSNPHLGGGDATASSGSTAVTEPLTSSASDSFSTAAGGSFSSYHMGAGSFDDADAGEGSTREPSRLPNLTLTASDGPLSHEIYTLLEAGIDRLNEFV